MTEQELWGAFVRENPEFRDDRYEAWSYGGGDPDALLELTIRGVKTATASAFPLYEYENSALPCEGDFSVILNSRQEAVCVIRTMRVTVVPFDQVTETHARREGEGDRSLAYWRSVHAQVFAQELEEAGGRFDEQMPVVCEEFALMYVR